MVGGAISGVLVVHQLTVTTFNFPLSTVINFDNDVETWSYKVYFSETEDKETRKYNEIEGIEILKYPIEVLACLVPKPLHGIPDIIQGKEDELKKFEEFNAFERVEDEGQPRIDTVWIVTKKEEHDRMKSTYKCRLCLRGFKENVDPRSDSPTASKESLNILMAVAANENFSIENIDVTSAFLQGKELEREVFVTPQKKQKKRECSGN